MHSEKMIELFNDQFNAELYSAYLYLAFSDQFERMGLDGFANWYRVQALEEIDHAMIIRRFLADQEEPLRFVAIGDVGKIGSEIEDILNDAKEHEELITSMINSLYDEAVNEDDRLSMNLLDWFIREQSEEEKNAGDLIRRFHLNGYCHSCHQKEESSHGSHLCGSGLFDMDRELSERRHVSPDYPLS